MKKLLVIVCVLCAAAVSTFAQGVINFNNSTTSKILLEDGTAAPVGSLTVGLFYNPNADATDISTFSLAATTGIKLPGIFSGGVIEIPGSKAGDIVAITVKAWSASFADYAAAETGGGLVGTWDQILKVSLGGGTLPTPSLAASGFTGFQVATAAVIPEPSTIALGILGAAALLLRRRN